MMGQLPAFAPADTTCAVDGMEVTLDGAGSQTIISVDGDSRIRR